MKRFSVGVYASCFITAALFFMASMDVGHGVRTTMIDHHVHRHPQEPEPNQEELAKELYPTGSTIPDCSHACGPCAPCKRVMISFKCSMAESCSVIYRCTCGGRYYHVPSKI